MYYYLFVYYISESNINFLIFRKLILKEMIKSRISFLKGRVEEKMKKG